jgi:hypothetical protein|tara:strand:- start:39 stop:233 length:195 start_codon:yes stop_codon:yes gene_type:complete
MTETKKIVRYGAGGSMYYETVKVETPVEPKKQVISEIFDEVKEEPKPKKKKKVIQEVFADNEEL